MSPKCKSEVAGVLCAATFDKLPEGELLIIRSEMEAMTNDSKDQDNKLVQCIDNLKIMVFTAEIMENLMMDLLDLAQMENNTFKMNKAFFSIFEAIEQAFSVVSHLAKLKQV